MKWFKIVAGFLFIFATLALIYRVTATPININGINVNSDKTVRTVINTRVTYEDGSWCDVSTGEVVNKGDGYIKMEGISSRSANSEMVTYGPKQFSTQTLTVRDINADVEVYPVEGVEMVVTIKGPKPDVDAIKVIQTRGDLWIKDKTDSSSQSTVVASVTNNGINACTKGRASVSVSIGGKSVNLGTIPNETKVTVGVPIGSAVRVSDIQGKIVIGDIEGPLYASIYYAENVSVGRVRDATLIVQGSTGMHVESVSGYLSMDVMGSGDIYIENGYVNRLLASVMGSGDAFFGGKAISADLAVMDSGNIYASYVKDKPVMNISGSGSITVHNW